MKKTLLITLVIMLSASMAFAQAGRIGLFGDATGAVESCGITDGTAGLLPIYVVHVETAGATACQFRAPAPACLLASGASWLSDAPVFAVNIGDSQNGIAIGYGACLTAPIHVLTIQFFASGTTAPCCVYEVIPDDDVLSGEVEVVDCEGTIIFGVGQSGVINPDATCACVDIVPVQDSSWGKIKSLFN
jgi:hypothetical protein